MQAIQKIEEILGITLEEKRYGDDYDPNQQNTYSIRKEWIESLSLDNVVIEDFSKLLPYLKNLTHLKIKNSTIPNFSQLLHLRYSDLRLDNVVFRNHDCEVMGLIPRHLLFFNMNFDANALKCFQKTKIRSFIRQFEFTNCHIDNIQEFNDLEPISLLILDNITFTHSPRKTSPKKTRRLEIENSKFEDLSFLPFQDSLESINFVNCQIGSIAGITEFPKLEKLAFDSDTSIKDKSILENSADKVMLCTITQEKKPLDLSIIHSLKNYIHELHLDKYAEKRIDFIEEFTNIKHLAFQESKVYIDAFLPIAKQIESISFRISTIENAQAFSEFKNLMRLQTFNSKEDCEGLESLKNLFPLKNQVKELDIYETNRLKDTHLIQEFSALESLKIGYDISIQTAEYILTLQNLKKLSFRIETEEEEDENKEKQEGKVQTLNLKNLKQLEYLSLDTGIVNVIGFEHLQKLKSFKIEEEISTETIDVNTLPKLESLQRLNIESYEYEIKGLAQFPNLEYLKIKGSPKITLSKLEHLKVLDLENSCIEGFATFEELPNLEELGLSSIQPAISLTDVCKFPNVKLLTLLESDIKDNDISYVASLKKLEYLDLYSTGVSDVGVLNMLPNLKEVNLATGTEENLEAQLEKPEIIIYCRLPSVCIWIWEEDEFGI